MLPVLYLAIALDLTLGEPPIWIHPVVWSGKISERLIIPYKGRAYGVFLWSFSVLPILFLLSLIFFIPCVAVELILAVVFLKTTFSIKMLYELVKRSAPVTEESRKYTQQLVRRNVYELDEGHVISAAIESLFESLVDGITAPLFWFLIFGFPGALLQRLANTMDSMVGYKTQELKDEGWFSATVDTVLNFIPARLTALFMILSAFLLGIRVNGVLRAIKESRIESPNARYPITTAAALLGVRLEKPGYYSVGDGELPKERDLIRALSLFKVTLLLYLFFISVVYYYLYGLSLFSYPYGLIELIKR
ncbi:cobalamin biosynthesis protein [Stygiolobus caldivivus]|uniref:Probable cobalamin biosynthesis protein CobD n=1 Tax=Stygiolobus caldivivus TaxID=2824673 RepID=A0A8D5U5T6_9CREN|nr:cobalamin biosynthesis protein [Stygiolobus caldivivus]BCU69396.1 adenosylcobinamide-phosphate synthase [Stygiolobus caldivivus]